MPSLRVGSETNPIRLAVFISGSGTGMLALNQFAQENQVCFEISVVISDKQSTGLAKAESASLDTELCLVSLDENKETRRREHEIRIQKILDEYNVEAIILSGYMRLLSAKFVSDWEGKVLNIHPSLLPKHPGAHAHKDVISSGDKQSGCTVHFVDAGMDTGQIIAQTTVPVFEDDTEESLAQRVKVEEHVLYPNIIQDFCSSDRIRSTSS